MKKTTYLWAIMCLMVSTLVAQTPAEMSEIQAANAVENSDVNVQELLDRLAATGSSPLADTQVFSLEERIALQQYYRQQNSTSTRMANIIPNAGLTESFAVVVGDFFYDPTDGVNGGPGGDCTTTSSGNPGDYPNCGCFTTTTLTGTDLEVEFLSFNVFGTFDSLQIFDGPDTASPMIYDSNLNADTDTLAGMIAANGGDAVFVSTTGALTFLFESTTVVNTCGWEVEVVPPGTGGGGGGGGGGDNVFAYDAGFCSMDMGTFDVAGPYTINVVGTSSTSIFSGDYDGSGTLYAMDNDTLSLITVDPTTGAETTVGPLTNIVAGHNTRGLAWDNSTSTMYLLSGLGDDVTLYTVDLATGTLTEVGTSTIVGLIGIWLAIDNDGNAYMADIGLDNFYSMDLTTGAATLIGPLGIDISFAQDADFDPATNILYMGAYIGGGVNEWASVDVTTGTATPLGAVNANCAELGIVAISGAVAVSNDECAGAIAMSCGDVEVGDTSTNTDTGGFNDSPDAWYSYTGSGDPEFVTFSLCDGGTAYDSRLTVYDVCGGVEIALNDDACGLQSEVSFLSDGTTTYFVAVEGFGTGDAGAFSLEVSCSPVAANDLCDDAIAVSCGDVISGSTNFATIDDAVAGNCDDTFDPTPFLPTVEVVSPGVWYSYTEPIPGFVQDITLDLCDAADFDTKISVYSGDCGALVCVAANDDNDDCTGFTSTVEFQSDGISTYYILVHGFNQTGNFDLSVNCAPVPPPNDMIVNSIDVDEIGFPYTDPAVNMPGATVEAGGTPADCDNAGVRGVWYNFVPEMGGTATASVTTPAAYTSVTFYTAPDEDSVETDLVLVDYFDNQCVPGADASILVTAGQPYYVYVANQGGVTDIVIDGDFYLGIGDTEIQGFSYFPNPAENQLNLRSGGGTIESAIIYNILGQEVLSERVGSSDAQLNVANLSVGTYILKVVVDGELGIYKIVKQ
ncbi:T9SS type A sorting domain-containing protein [Rasiella rasia]|uniref:T9SS type A sorting domain-containing protein n=1 Tax=Rasiella rasia TaxID=2744027 RepID=A0A6G6GQ88_9FLAO|nr:T9SS type A sorting domain-containing protein [Rasiella rasia]QIE60718.1 T9SS type A sorting domain-containing protein [Rasiella rasia]